MGRRAARDHLLTTSEAASRLGISRYTLLRASKRGEIAAAARTPGGDLRFAPEAVERYAAELAARAAARTDARPRRLARDADAQVDVLARLLAASPQPACVYDGATLRLRAVNAAAVRLYGYPPDEFLRLSFTDLWPPEDMAGARQARERAAASAPWHGEWRHRRKDGQLIDVEVAAYPTSVAGPSPGETLTAPTADPTLDAATTHPTRDAATMASPALGVAAITDVTARKRAREALRRSEHLLAVQSAGTQVLAQSERLEETIPCLLRAVCEQLHWDLGCYWRVDASDGLLRCPTVWHRPDAALAAFAAHSGATVLAPDEGPLGRLRAGSSALWVEDVAVQWHGWERAAAAAEADLHTAVLVPVPGRDGGPGGLLEFYCAQALPADEALGAMLLALGGLLGQAIARARAGEALRRSEAQHRRIVETAQEGIVQSDADNRITYVNRKLAEMLGYTMDELIGRPIITLVAEDAHALVEANQRRRREGYRQNYLHDLKLRTKGGDDLWVIVASTPIFDADGQFRGGISLLTDITERRRAEQAVSESEAQYRRIVEAAQEGIWQVDSAGVTTYVNAKMAALLGYTVAEMLGQSCYAFMGAETRALAARRREQRLQGKADVDQVETAYLRKDGTALHVLVTSSPLFDEQGCFAGSVSLVTDITARIAMEEALRASEAEYRLIVETASEGIVHFDQAFRIITANRRLAEMLGYRIEELIGQPALIFAAPEQHAAMEDRWARRQRGDSGNKQYDLKLRRKDGSELWAAVSGSPLYDSQGRHIGGLALLTDITERKQAEEALRASEERYRQVEAHAAIGLALCAPDGRWLRVNPALCALVGYSA